MKNNKIKKWKNHFSLTDFSLPHRLRNDFIRQFSSDMDSDWFEVLINLDSSDGFSQTRLKHLRQWM